LFLACNDFLGCILKTLILQGYRHFFKVKILNRSETNIVATPAPAGLMGGAASLSFDSASPITRKGYSRLLVDVKDNAIAATQAVRSNYRDERPTGGLNP
jgi:hypothetical protein